MGGEHAGRAPEPLALLIAARLGERGEPVGQRVGATGDLGEELLGGGGAGGQVGEAAQGDRGPHGAGAGGRGTGEGKCGAVGSAVAQRRQTVRS
jgi:hypothetical protein